MTRISLSLALALGTGASAASADPVAHSQFRFDTPQHAQPVDGAIWYPAAEAGAEQIFAEYSVFRGVPVQRDVDVADGAHPVVLLSHGMGGGIRSMAWLAAGLAERGAIVVAVTHPQPPGATSISPKASSTGPGRRT